MAAHGHPARVRWTGSLDDGTDGADAILFQLRIGGQAARQRDETWPLDCGCVGQETTGAGGLAKALRTVPIVLDLAERASRRASPSAFIIDFTNPVGIVTRALLSAGYRAVGLCNVAIGFQRHFACPAGSASGSGPARPRRPEPPDLGALGAGGRQGRAARPARHPGGRDRAAHRAARRLRPPPGHGAVVLPALLLRPRRGGRRPARGGDPRRGSGPAGDRTARAVRGPGAGPQAAPAGPARRRVVLRGGGGPAPFADWQPARRPSGQHGQRLDAALPARRRGHRGTRRNFRAAVPFRSASTRSSRCCAA